MKRVVEWVNTQHATENWVRFTPAGVELSLGVPQDEALKVLRTMAAAGMLRIEVQVVCNEGHCAWQGPADQVPGYNVCQVCDFPASEDPDDYALSEHFIWVEQPLEKLTKAVEQGTVINEGPLVVEELAPPDTCVHLVKPFTNCIICFA